LRIAAVPAEANIFTDYVSESQGFLPGRHDDQVDSTAQAVAWAKLREPARSGVLDRVLSGAGVVGDGFDALRTFQPTVRGRDRGNKHRIRQEVA
jgi:hypothetical protein